MKKLILFPLLLCALSCFLISCTGSQYALTKGSASVSIAPNENPRLLYSADLKEQQLLSFAAKKDDRSRGSMLEQAISLAIMGTTELIAMEQKKYAASHSLRLGHLYFYDQISYKGPYDPTGMQFDGVEILRTVDLKEGTDTAFYFLFEVDKENIYEIINNSMFNMVLKDFNVKYSKAKLSKTKWYNPITWGEKKKDEMLNMDIEIVLKTSYLSQSGIMINDEEIGKFFFAIRDLPMNPAHKNYYTAREKYKGRTLQGFSFVIPRSTGYRVGANMELEEVYSQGRFSVDVSINESGKDKFISKTFYDNSEKLLKDAEKTLIKALPGQDGKK